MTSLATETEGEENQIAKLSVEREKLMEKGRESGRALLKIKREQILWNASADLKGVPFVNLYQYASVPLKMLSSLV